MSKVNFLIVVAVLVVTISNYSCEGQRQELEENKTSSDLSGWNEVQLTAEELSNWQLLGEGSVFTIMNEQTCLTESDESEGMMLLSPTYYEGDVVVRYKALALSPASIFVTILSAKDRTGNQLTIPESYDGSMGFWTDETNNYFFAFKNAPHGGTPFITKNPNSAHVSDAPDQDKMVAGIYYDIEVGREGTNLWLSINGDKVVDMEDDTPIAGGHIALRLRGTAGLKATGLIKNFTIYSK